VRRKSVLCFPIVKQARLVGVLYLENDLVTGAFTPGRLAVLELLAAQAAISRENAALYADLGRNVAALRQAERERITRLRFVESADRINRAIQGAPDVDAMMTDTLDAVLDIFECDRAFLLHPCDPDAPTWQVPMERTRPEYPGLFVRGTEAPMDDDVARTLRVLLASDGPVRFGPDMEHPTPREVSERFGIRAFLSMALRPKVGPPWQFGIHQCSHVRVWQPEDVLLLQEIGRRLADGLTSLLMLRELRRSEEALRRSERRKTILNAVANVFLTVPDDEMYGRVLDEVLAVMRSRFGFFGFIAESGDFVVPSLTRGIWDHCSVEEKSTVFPPSAWGASLWGKAIREQRTQCSDGPFHTPEGHFVLEHVLAVPVTRGTDTIGLLCVANGERSYAGEDRELLESIAGNISPILDARLRREWQEQKRKQAEEALRKLSRAVEQSPASIVVTDTAGKIEYVNPKFTEIAGYTSEEVLGENPRLLKSGEMSLSTYEVLWRTITAGKTWHGEFHNRKKSGELFWALASISPITDADGKITHYVAVAEDITARKGLEDQLRQAQKMEAVGQLAGGVAHDFNNILTATLMTISLLLDEPQLTDDLRAGLEDLDCHARRAASLTRQLLLFSRRQTIEARPVNLNEVVTNLSKMLRRLIGEDIDLAVGCQSAPLMANADPGMLEQVLMNLCVNARDAMPRGGSLSIATSRVVFDGEPSAEDPEGRTGSFICLSVTDSGCGMDDETKAHIFEPFFTTKGVGRGTGLGLATVYGIVNEHRGWVQVESAVGRGAVFRVYLPARPECTDPLQNPTLASVRGGTETILLVEDDVSLRRLATGRLRSLGYTVFEAGNGGEALTTWGELRGRVDLLLTDMVMPGGMTGLDLAERLVQQSPGLRIILVSGYNREKITTEMLAATGITFVAKPYDAVVLAGTVRACLDRPKTLQPRGGA
jgi:PAS domain S-box-containing protein